MIRDINAKIRNRAGPASADEQGLKDADFDTLAPKL